MSSMNLLTILNIDSIVEADKNAFKTLKIQYVRWKKKLKESKWLGIEMENPEKDIWKYCFYS